MPNSSARVGVSTDALAASSEMRPVARKAKAPSSAKPVRSSFRPGSRPSATSA
jgi:hypothetical protein